MARFLTTTETSSEIERIIRRARKELILVSPFLQISKTFYERLEDASDQGISITIIYGKDELNSKERSRLNELKNLQLFFFENLHAKCYYNESKMVITSMNMYEFSEKNNREMGVLIDHKIDFDLYDDAVEETKSIIRSAEKITLRQPKKKNSFFNHRKKTQGYCIRCSDTIEYNPERPYCDDCYAIWFQFENFEYQENNCHKCGEAESSSMNKPQCYQCWKESVT